MSSPSYRTEFRSIPQEADPSDQEYVEFLKHMLPANLEEKALQLGAWQRSREIESCQDLLRGLLYRAICNRSFDQVAGWATLKGIACLSGEGWRKRFIRSATWIEWVLSEMLSIHQRPGWLSHEAPHRGRVLLVDATREGTVAGTGDDVRLHWSYDLRAGKSVQIAISDRYEAEGLRWFQMQAGDIMVTDAGYPIGSTVQRVRDRQADCITRVTPTQMRLETETGERIDLKQQLSQQPYASAHHLMGWIVLPSGQREYVRLVAYRLPKEISQQAQARKEQKLRAKRGRTFNRELVWWAGWVVLVTTLPLHGWSDETVARLYRARWQIELLFKRLKQGLDWHRIALKEWGHIKIEVQLKIIIWLLQEQQQQEFRHHLSALLREPELQSLPEEEEEQTRELWIVSSWAVSMQTLDWLRGVLRGYYSGQRLHNCIPLMRRYWCSRPRKTRRHQETTVRDWLTGTFGGSGPVQALPFP